MKGSSRRRNPMMGTMVLVLLSWGSWCKAQTSRPGTLTGWGFPKVGDSFGFA